MKLTNFFLVKSLEYKKARFFQNIFVNTFYGLDTEPEPEL